MCIMHCHHQSLSRYRFHPIYRSSQQRQSKNLRMTMILVSIVQDGDVQTKDRYHIIKAQCEQQPMTLAPAGQVQYQPRISNSYTLYETEFLYLHWIFTLMRSARLCTILTVYFLSAERCSIVYDFAC